MHAVAAAQKHITPYSCAEAWAAALPPHGETAAQYRRVMARTDWRVRCARNPMLGARFVARFARCRSIPAATPNRVAWGMADGGNGRHVFAYWTGAHWWARSAAGITRVHAGRIVKIWSVE